MRTHAFRAYTHACANMHTQATPTCMHASIVRVRMCIPHTWILQIHGCNVHMQTCIRHAHTSLLLLPTCTVQLHHGQALHRCTSALCTCTRALYTRPHAFCACTSALDMYIHAFCQNTQAIRTSTHASNTHTHAFHACLMQVHASIPHVHTRIAHMQRRIACT